jgi:glycosyltransferase involved in cell wall biosynthesis
MITTLFDLGIGGHHSVYIKHLVSYWITNISQDNILQIVVVPNFLTKHSEVVDLSSNVNNINFVSISDEDSSKISSIHSSIVRSFVEWDFFCKYTHMLKTDHAYLLYFDHLQLPIVLGKKPSCPFSGIYFRPTYHYHTFLNHQFNLSDYFRAFRQKILFQMVLKNQMVKNIFCLDGFAVDYIKKEKFSCSSKVIYIPDPVEYLSPPEGKVENLKKELGINPTKKIFLSFGSIDLRKGILEILDAIPLLSDEIRSQLCLVVAGAISPSAELVIKSKLEEIISSFPIQIIFQNSFIQECDVDAYFSMADSVIIPYKYHVGSSGVQLKAVSANKPVITSNYGLMGKLTSTYKIGISIDSEQPKQIAESICLLISSQTNDFFDSEICARLADKHTVYKFSSTLLNN